MFRDSFVSAGSRFNYRSAITPRILKMRKTKGISFRRILSHERCEWFRVIRMHTKAETNININACTRGGCHECGWYDTVKPNEGIGEYLKCISPRSPECARRKAGGWYRGNSRCPAGERIPRVFSNSCMRVRVSSRETHICFRCVINWTYFRSVASVTIDQLLTPHNLWRNVLRRFRLGRCKGWHSSCSFGKPTPGFKDSPRTQ